MRSGEGSGPIRRPTVDPERVKSPLAGPHNFKDLGLKGNYCNLVYNPRTVSRDGLSAAQFMGEFRFT